MRLRRWRRLPAPRRLVPHLLITALAAATVAGLAVRADIAVPEGTASHVVIAGVVGLRWDDVDPTVTPNLWRLAGRGAIGALAVRSAHRPTCPVDGWLTLGAGNWAGHPAPRRSGTCPPVNVTIEPSGAGGAHLPEQEEVVRDNRWRLPYGAVPGALAGAVECTTAIGEGGALAAARTYGRVDRYVPRLPPQGRTLAALLARCELTIADLGMVTGEGPARRAEAAAADRALGRLMAARPSDSLLLVAGVADTGPDRRLRVVVAEGAGLTGGWLTSPTTRREGYVQLVDLAPTALAAVARPAPEVRLAGHPVQTVPGRTGVLADDIRRLVDADHEAGLTRPMRTWFLLGVAVVQLALLAAIVPLLRSRPGTYLALASLRPPGPTGARPSGPPDGPARVRRRPSRTARRGPLTRRLRERWRRAAPLLLTASAVIIPAALVADALPWWRAGAAGVWYTALCVGLAAATATAVSQLVPPGPLAVTGACAVLAATAVTADLLTGSGLQLNSVVGYSAHDGDRYSGLGAVGAGLLIAGVLLAAGCLAQRADRRWRPTVVVAVGAAGVVVAGNPYLGADVGTAVALTAGVCLAAALSTGGWLTFGRIAWAALAGVAVTGAVAMVDLRRPVEQRSGLGRLFVELANGTAGFGLQRVSLANWEALVGSPMTLVAAVLMGFVWLVLLRPWGGLKRLFGLYPALRAGMLGTAVAAPLGGIVTGSALTVAGTAAAVAVPLAAVASLRIRQPVGEAADAPRSAGAAPAAGTRRVLW
ncbi:MAG: hypothetical protein FWJ70_12000 [Micromonosporaceae bacterium]